MKTDEFSVDRFDRGSREALWIDAFRLPGGEIYRFPVFVVRGQEDGKRLLTCAGVHGDEYEGMEAIRNVYAKLDPGKMSGMWVGVPVVNMTAFAVSNRTNYYDNEDLARVFPGSSRGTLTEQIGHHFVETFMNDIDLFCDLHSAGGKNKLKRFAGYALNDDPILTIQREAAIAFGLDLVRGSSVGQGFSLSVARSKGIPAVYVEMPGGGLCRHEDVKADEHGTMNLMRYLGIIEGDYPKSPPRYFVETPEDPPASRIISRPGFLRLHVGVWQLLQKGDLVAEVIDPLGEVLETIDAPLTGRILLLRSRPSVLPGDMVCELFPETSAPRD